jgi:hypothetical protein
MDLEVYKRKLGANSSSEALMNASIEQIKSMFKESPLYKVILLDGVSKGVRVNFEKENERQLLLQPQGSAVKGTIADFDGHKWLVTKVKPDIVYPKAQVVLCNQVVKWNDGTTTHEYPSVAIGKSYDLDEAKDYMNIPEGQVVAQIPYNSNTKTIKIGQRFLLGDKAYEVIGIDDITNILNGTGIIVATLEITSKADTDDAVNKVADNNTSGWGGGW